jgi:hypothetical protein
MAKPLLKFVLLVAQRVYQPGSKEVGLFLTFSRKSHFYGVDAVIEG